MKTTVLLFAFLFVIPSYVFGSDLHLQVGVNKYPMTTVGNHTYVDISKYGRPDENKNRDEILNILSEFEKTSNKEIMGWKIEKQQKAYTTFSYLYGLWIDHRPKQKKQYFFCLCAQTSQGGVSYTNGTIDVEEGQDIQKTLDKIKACGAKRYECNEDKVVVTAFNKIE